MKTPVMKFPPWERKIIQRAVNLLRRKAANLERMAAGLEKKADKLERKRQGGRHGR